MIPKYILIFVLLILLVKIVRNQELTAEILSVKLPEQLQYTESVYDGKDAFYIIGGYTEGASARAEIYKYSLTDGRLTQEGLLPSPRSRGKTVMDDKNENIYYFGGADEKYIREICHFNLATKTTTVVGNLSNWSYEYAAVSYNDVTSKVFLIGGYTTPQLIQCWDIDLQINCPTQTMDTSFSLASAVLYGNEAFVFGNANGTSESDPVYKINLDTFQTSFGERTLPNLQLQPNAVVIAGSNAYIIGGWNNQTNFTANSIIQINLHSLEQTVLAVKNFIPDEDFIYGISAVYVEKFNRIYVVGGISFPHGPHDEIWSIDLNPINVPTTTTEPTSTPTSEAPSTVASTTTRPSSQAPTTSPTQRTTENPTTSRPTSTLQTTTEDDCDHEHDEFFDVVCPPHEDDIPTYFPYPYDCLKYIICTNGEAAVECCANGTRWDQDLLTCNHQDVIDCIIVTTGSTIRTTTT